MCPPWGVPRGLENMSVLSALGAAGCRRGLGTRRHVPWGRAPAGRRVRPTFFLGTPTAPPATLALTIQERQLAFAEGSPHASPHGKHAPRKPSFCSRQPCGVGTAHSRFADQKTKPLSLAPGHHALLQLPCAPRCRGSGLMPDAGSPVCPAVRGTANKPVTEVKVSETVHPSCSQTKGLRPREGLAQGHPASGSRAGRNLAADSARPSPTERRLPSKGLEARDSGWVGWAAGPTLPLCALLNNAS